MSRKDVPVKGKRVTLAHVAQRAGVSRAAASFVMSGRTDQRLSEDVFRRVRKAAEELGYRPSLTAQTLRTGRSGAVAFVSDFVSITSFANTMVRGAMEELRHRDTLLFTVDTQGDAGLEERLLMSLLDRNIDGVIYASMFTRIVSVPPLLENVPVVLLNCVAKDSSGISVVPDEITAGADAARLLLDAGHREGVWFVGALPSGQIGGAAWPGWAPIALSERRLGIDRAFAEAGTSLSGTVVVENDWDIANGRSAVARLLESGTRPRALLCVNDAVAVGACQALRRKGLIVPDDVSVVGFDGSPLAQAGDPEITTLALPQLELGRRAAALLTDPDRTPRIERIRMPVVLGGSVGASPGAKLL